MPTRTPTGRSPRGKTTLRTRKSVVKVRQRATPASRARRTIAWTLLALLACGLVGVLGFVIALWHYGRDLPSLEALRNYQPPQTSRVVDRNGELIGEIFTERRTVVSAEAIPRNLVLCVLAAEDASFYEHRGLDYMGIARALGRDVLSGRAAQGASTITQQVVKLLLLTPERTLARKVRELILARKLEQELSKEEILLLYLNHINFGHGRHGVQEAARYYFAKDVSELTLAEATLIAGIPQAPARLSPRKSPEAARTRQLYVLRQLSEKRAKHWPDLSQEEIDKARETNVEIAPPPEASSEAPEVLALARRTLNDLVGDEAFKRGGYTVRTTVDLATQRAARESLRKGLEDLDDRHGYRGPLTKRKTRRRRSKKERESSAKIATLKVGSIYPATVKGSDDEGGMLVIDIGGHEATVPVKGSSRYNPEALVPSEFAEIGARLNVRLERMETEDQPPEAVLELGPQGAIVVIDPRTRELLALVGGYDAITGFDRASAARRQPGSTFKPIVYALGIRSRRFSPASVVLDAPAVYDQWQPDNYESWRYEGAISLRRALAKSVNVVAVRVMEEVQPQAAVSFAQQLGIKSELEGTLALALGASAVTPLEMANAYATFAAGGRWSEPKWLERIEGPDGAKVALPRRELDRDVLTPAEAYLVTSMLESVVREGTATSALRLGRPAAGKTGTSNKARDAWYIGYTPEIVAAVWVGFDDNRSLGKRESGGKSALPIWIDTVEKAIKGKPIVDFPRPSGIVTAMVDPTSGLLAYEGLETAVEEVFLEGMEPTEAMRPADLVDPGTFLMEELSRQGAGGATMTAPAAESPR